MVLEIARNVLQTLKMEKEMQSEPKYYAYKIKELDGRISAYVIRNIDSDTHLCMSFSFENFLENLLCECGQLLNRNQQVVVCSPPVFMAEIEGWGVDEDFERVPFEDHEIEEMRKYCMRRNLPLIFIRLR